jgi:ribosomal protein S27AE
VGQGAFGTEAATATPPVQAKGGPAAKEKGTGLSLGALFGSRPKADTGERTQKAVPTEGSTTAKSDERPTTTRSVRPASPPTSVSTKAEGTGGPGRETLLHWLNHVTRDKQVYERCPGCGSYAFMDVRKKGDTVRFSCKRCDSEYKLVL